MSNPIVECIPNFSEGRRPEVVKAIMAAVSSVAGVQLLDHSSDLDHNRSVLTFAGPPQAVEEAAFRGIQKAAELIDLNQHTGEHPRIGATDVVPFVPISGVSIADCVAMANRLGQRVGDVLGIPVYLYEYAATRPERTNLENIRRGEYEALKEEIGVEPDRDPDYGPKKVGSAGATVIGARDPLIAYNVYLTTGEVEIAREIAKAVRHSSGGLRYVKGLGLLVEGRAQVSMNLTNFHQTSVARVVETIRREAVRHGVAIHHSELIGLIPQEALADAAAWYLQLDGFQVDQILEQRLYATAQTELAAIAGSFLDDLASGSPTPGGGSAAAYAAAMGASLVVMVARLTIGKKKYVGVEAQMQDVLERAESLRTDLTTIVDEDATAFESVMSAFKLPKETSEQAKARNEAIQLATLHAAQVPLEVARKAVQVIELAEDVAKVGNLNAISDAASGAAMARAALTAAGYNVRINVASLDDKSAGESLLAELRDLEARASESEQNIRSSLRDRGGISPD
jgi:glutamate formiminotransferase/formiminotetrahydrofolate cyclodeaminase